MRISDISTMNQSFIAIYDGENRFCYLFPGEILAKAIVPFSLSNVFKEFCYDDFSKAVDIGAVAGLIRAPYPNEVWKNTADTLVMLKPIRHKHVVSDIWSLYRGLEGLIKNENFPILIPEQSIVYNGIKILEYLAKFPEYYYKVEETLQRWVNLPKMMEKEITREKPNTKPNTIGVKITENKATLPTFDGICRRTSARIRAHGVVVMTDLEKPVVATSYDIAPGGVSFVHLSDFGVVGGDIMMDILIFDTHTNKEHSVSQIKGKIRSKERVFDPESQENVLRFGVEFIELDSPQKDILRSCLDQTEEYFLDP